MATFTITVPGGTVQLSGNPILIVGTTSTTGKTDHKLLCKVTCTDGAILGGPWVDDITPLAGAATFDISGLVDGVFAFSFSTDITTPAKVYTHDQLAATITVDIGESYIDTDGSLVETWNNDAETINVLKGGLSNYMLGVMAENGESFFSNYITNPHFLSRQQTTYHLPTSSYMKLWFIPNSATQYNIVVTATYTDGSTKQQTNIASYLTTKLYEINTNLAAWSDITATNNGFEMTNYVVSVRKNSGGVGNFVVIYPDTTYHETITEFYYANQLGGVDLVVCTGELSENPSTSGESYVKNNSVTPVSTIGTTFYDRKTISRKYKCNTGFVSLEQRRSLLDFFMSQYCWWRTDRFGKPTSAGFGLVPINVIPGSYQIDTTSEDLKFVEFEFEIAHVDKYI